MRTLPLASLFGLATLGAQAQVTPTAATPFDPIVVTASRSLVPAQTVRDATVITREDLDAAGNLSLAEVLQRRAGIEIRPTGGPGQPTGMFVRGAGSAQTLVLIDGQRAGSVTIGTTSIENIPLDLVERIEVIKGPLSSLYGSDAIGGVIQIFTRGAGKPHLFGNAAYGSYGDGRLSAGIEAVEGKNAFALSAGARKVDAPSATTERVSFCHDPDRDPYENAFANLRASHRLWQGELLQIEGFVTKGRTDFDGCGTGDRNDQTISGARFTSTSQFSKEWSSRLAFGEGRDKLVIHGAFPDKFESRQQQFAWINEVTVPGGTAVSGYEKVRAKVVNNPDGTVFSKTERDTDSIWAGITQAWEGQRIEASIRRDDDDAFGARNTGSVGYGFSWPGWGRLSATVGRGFRAPTFYDLYGPSSDFYQPNAQLQPEQSKSTEISLRSEGGPIGWRATAFDNRIEDLIVYVFPTVENVKRARIKGVELAADGKLWGAHWQAAATFQRPRDDDTGLRLQGRAEQFGTFTASRTWGAWTGAFTILASGDRFDSTHEAAESRLPGYATLDARVTYRVNKFTSVELALTNLTDKRYESAVGYEGTRRTLLASVRFEAF
jgi:vitamin B12 transporter